MKWFSCLEVMPPQDDLVWLRIAAKDGSRSYKTGWWYLGDHPETPNGKKTPLWVVDRLVLEDAVTHWAPIFEHP